MGVVTSALHLKATQKVPAMANQPGCGDFMRLKLRYLPFLAALVLAVLFTITHAAAQQQKILINFENTDLSGQSPEGGLIFDQHGNMYGVTYSGGSSGFGTVFEMSPAGNGTWTIQYIYNFRSVPDGQYPIGALVMDSLGNLYGTTSEGGSQLCSDGYNDFGCGTVFELSPSGLADEWKETILHNFNAGAGDGYLPLAGLTMDPAGKLYGTTAEGGGQGVSLGGTVFEVGRSAAGQWNEKVVHRFGTGADGLSPRCALILDKAGNLYGTTASGGGVSQMGTVFELTHTTSGWREQILLNFNSDRSGTSGNSPAAGLVSDRMGNLYGTTIYGGTLGFGNVFELQPTKDGGWSERVLHSFSQQDSGGYFPQAPLVLDSAGNLYGVMFTGGSGIGRAGTVFRLNRSANSPWTETVLHSFQNSASDGINPNSGLALDSIGNLYGETQSGGAGGSGAGTIFVITP
jgi:uncharacterized repeat protein (TIGR03803 family)